MYHFHQGDIVSKRTKEDLIRDVATKAPTSLLHANQVITAFFQAIEESVARGESITIPGYLTIEVKDRAARTGRNPRTGEVIEIPAHKGVKITPGTRLKAAANR